jgi:hypothetical protein
MVPPPQTAWSPPFAPALPATQTANNLPEPDPTTALMLKTNMMLTMMAYLTAGKAKVPLMLMTTW